MDSRGLVAPAEGSGATAVDGVQWFTDNRSLWLCMGIQVDRRVLPTLFGLTDKQVEKCLFLEESRTGDEYAIGMDGDEPVLDYCGDVWEYDQRLLAFRGKAGMLFVPRAWADAVAVTDETQYTVRMLQNSDGKPEPMVAVYNGMICKAVAPLPSAGATSPRESFGFQRGAAGTRLSGSGAYKPITRQRGCSPPTPPCQVSLVE